MRFMFPIGATKEKQMITNYQNTSGNIASNTMTDALHIVVRDQQIIL